MRDQCLSYCIEDRHLTQISMSYALCLLHFKCQMANHPLRMLKRKKLPLETLFKWNIAFCKIEKNQDSCKKDLAQNRLELKGAIKVHCGAKLYPQ